MALYQQKEWARAEEVLSKIGYGTTDAHFSALYFLAHSQIAQYKLKDAAVSFERLASHQGIRKSQLAEVHLELGYIYEELREFERAVSNMEKSLELDPDQPHLLFAVGTLYGELGQIERAREVFESALKVAPDVEYRVAAHTALGRALSELGEDDAARQHLETALKLAPGHKQALDELNRLPRTDP